MKRVVIIAVALVVALGLGLGGGLLAGRYLAPLAPGSAPPAPPEPKAPPNPDLIYDLPETLAALDDASGRGMLLRLGISVECPTAEDLSKLQEYLPRVLDVLQVYLRTQQLKDLRGVKNVERLRGELKTRMEAVIAPGKINRLLFRDMTVQ